MAEIRCPSCGKNNPDFLDRCQFCQSSLRSESTLRAGESPTKKHTGELEPILPDWLKDLREQGRQSAEEVAAQKTAGLKEQRNEPADFLAGLASQAGTEEEEIPDWLASIDPATKNQPSESPPREPASSLEQQDQGSQPEQREERDELTEWFSQASEQGSEPFILEPGESQDDLEWISKLGSAAKPLGESASPQGEEDLSWLHDLEASAKQAVEPSRPRQDPGSRPSSQPSSGEEDLSWLNNFGGIVEPVQPPEETQPQSVSEEHSGSQEDLNWLDELGGTEPLNTVQSPAPAEDLSWLDRLGRTEASGPEPAKPAPEEDLEWRSPTALSPRQTAPLGEESESETVPDWLKSAKEKPSMPPLGAGALDWFASDDLGEGQPAARPELPADQAEERSRLTPTSESQPASDQDIDALFSIDVPDWLSGSEAGPSDVSVQETKVRPAEGAESLAPVELPSWVQAMKPVEAVVSETAASPEDQALETDGPLAGLRGVIPVLPIGSSRRPKALSLTLQTTDEQQEGAAILERILAGETTPRALVGAPTVVSQSVLRWALAAIVLTVLGAMIALGSRSLPISTALPTEVAAASNAVRTIPEGAPVLVVLDYQPSLASEMEAISGPLLSNIVLSRHSGLSFLSTSPSGPGLVERLRINTQIDAGGGQPLNLGYLPGGSAGVLAFIESPQTARPLAAVRSFSEYAAVIVLTDHAESGRAWVEQLDARKQSDSTLASQPFLIVASAQAGPLLQPYAASRQVTGIISGLPDAARYESAQNLPPGIARTYWDAFGTGLLLAIMLILFGSLWNLITRIRPRQAGAEQS